MSDVAGNDAGGPGDVRPDAEVRAGDLDKVTALVAAARDVDTARRSLDYAAPELVATKIGRLDAAMERLRAALAGLEE